jgi:two-component system sensor histidine kinase KdpD
MLAMKSPHGYLTQQQTPCHGQSWLQRTLAYLGAILACALVTLIGKSLSAWVGPANIDMLFLLTVFLVAWRLGRGPALLAALLSVLLFDFFFVPPHFTLDVEDSQYLISFVVMLAVALITGQLAAGARERLHLVEIAQDARMQAEAERLRNTILASLSHDLRTPLTALLGLADTLALARLPAPHDETARVLRDQAKDMAAMVNNLLDLARLSAGNLPLRKEWQLLEDVVGTTIHLLEPALEGRPVSVTLADDLPLLEFDAVLLERALGNLLDNAVRHTPAGTAIRIDAHRLGEQVEISVIDAGPGFPNGAPQPSLGLTICRAIVEAHGGQLILDNAGGARARIILAIGAPPAIPDEIDVP